MNFFFSITSILPLHQYFVIITITYYPMSDVHVHVGFSGGNPPQYLLPLFKILRY